MYVRNVELTDIVIECSDIKTFFFDHRFDFIPGQYVMIWIRGVDEIPMSLSYADAITVRSVGEATSELFKLSIGDEIGIRGPYGNGFKDPDNSVLLIAGGLGAAPLSPLAETLNRRSDNNTWGKNERRIAICRQIHKRWRCVNHYRRRIVWTRGLSGRSSGAS